MRRFCWLLLALAAFLPTLAQAQAPLGWKWQGPFYAEVTTSQQRSTKIQGKALDQSRDLTLLLAVRPQKSAEGTRVIELTVESVKVTSPGKFKVPEELILKALDGAELKATLGPDLRVVQLEGLDDVVKKAGGPQTAALRETLQASFEGMVTFLLGELFVPLPDKAVQKGDRWQQTSTLRLATFGTLELKKDLIYEGKGRLPFQSLDRVGAEGKFSFAPAKEGGAAGVKVLRADVKSGEYKGTLHFDPAAGRLARAEVKLKADVAVTVQINKQKTLTQGTQEESLVIRTFDQKPAGK